MHATARAALACRAVVGWQRTRGRVAGVCRSGRTTSTSGPSTRCDRAARTHARTHARTDGRMHGRTHARTHTFHGRAPPARRRRRLALLSSLRCTLSLPRGPLRGTLGYSAVLLAGAVRQVLLPVGTERRGDAAAGRRRESPHDRPRNLQQDEATPRTIPPARMTRTQPHTRARDTPPCCVRARRRLSCSRPRTHRVRIASRSASPAPARGRHPSGGARSCRYTELATAMLKYSHPTRPTHPKRTRAHTRARRHWSAGTCTSG